MNIKRLIIWFWLLVKKTLRTPLMAVLLISMPTASCIGLGVTTGTFDSIACVSHNGDKSERPSAALYVCDNDDVAVKIADNLCQLNSVVRYYMVDDKDTFYNDVRSGVADFGYIFRDRLTERLDNKSYRGVIRLAVSDSSYITSISNEIVFKELFKVYSLNIAVNYVESKNEFDSMRQQAIAELTKRYEAYSINDDISYFRFEVLDDDGGSSELETVAVNFPIRGILGVMVMIAAMSGGVMYCRDRKKGIFMALTRKMSYVGAVLYVAVPTILFAISAEISMLILGEAAFPGEAVSMILYVFILVIVNSLLALVVRDASVFAGAIPVCMVASLVFCPIFFNLTGVMPVIRYLNYLLPVSYYL